MAESADIGAGNLIRGNPKRNSLLMGIESDDWYTHKTSGFKTSGFKTSGFKTSGFKTSGLRNVRFTKRQVSKRLVSKRPVSEYRIYMDVFLGKSIWIA